MFLKVNNFNADLFQFSEFCAENNGNVRKLVSVGFFYRLLYVPGSDLCVLLERLQNI